MNAVQEGILLGRVEFGEGMIWMQAETGSETAEVCIPISNIAGIQWEEQEV